MATKKNAKKDPNEERATAPGAWRVLLPVAGAALAALGPALALGGKAIRDRREQPSRMPALAIIPTVAGLIAVIGAMTWRNRDRVMEIAGDAVAAAEEMAGDVAGRLTADGASDEPSTPEPYETFGAPVTQGSPAA